MSSLAKSTTSRRISWFACFVLVFVSAFSLSGTKRPPLALDPSWNAVIEYATTHHWQFGTQIVFTYGPLGFLAAPTSLGNLVGVRIAFAIFWGMVVALTATAVAKRLPHWTRYAFIGWLVWFTLSEGLDPTAFWVLASGTLLLLMDGPRSRWRTTLYAGTLVILALIKISFFTAGLASLTLLAGCWLRQGKIRAATSVVVGSAAGFILGWKACGQSVPHLVPWIKSGLELESGYSGAMNLSPKASVLCFALAALLIFIGALIALAVGARGNILKWAAVVTLAQYGFLAWKEGFTRCGDWHAFVFLWFLPLGVGLFLIKDLDGETTRRLPLEIAFAGSLILCLFAAHFQIPGFALVQVRDWPQRFAHNARGMLEAVTGHGDSLFTDSRDHEQGHSLFLEHAQDVIGNDSVDVMNYLQVAAIANGMNYRPRPVFQGFVAYTPALQGLNEQYFKSPRRPHYVMLCQQATDARFPNLEDSAALNDVLNNYVPVARDGRFLILQQQTAKDLKLQPVDEETLSFGKDFDLRRWAKGPLFISAEITPNLLGKAIQTVYQLQPLSLRVLRDGEEQRYRIVPSMAERPFLISPVLDSNFDVINFYTAQPGKQLESVTIERPERGAFEFHNAVRLRLYSAPEFPFAAKRVSALRMIADVQGRVFWPLPASVESASPARLRIFHGTSSLEVNAPSKLVVNVPQDASSLSGYFGVPDEAYTGGLKTPEVTISVVVQDPAGKVTWRLDRMLNPSVRAEDRGRFSFHAPIDGSRDRTVTLTTATDPATAEGIARSVWSMCRIEAMAAR